jgi:hypothetical protein
MHVIYEHAATYAEQAQCGLVGGDGIILFTLTTAVACWVVYYLLFGPAMSQGSVFHSIVIAYLGSPLA